MSPDTWAALAEAHARRRERFADLQSDSGRTPVHRPVAAVLGCSDARVSPSAVFDQDVGELFEVRVAGNTVGPAVLASLDYAVAHLGVRLVIALGHTYCGAVLAAIDQADAPIHWPTGLSAIVDPIAEIVRQHPEDDQSEIAHLNVAQVATHLTNHFDSQGWQVSVLGAVHDIKSGRLLPSPLPQG